MRARGGGGGGVAWIDLAPLDDGALVAEHVASALGAPERPRTPALARVVEAVGPRRALLVLDNCEHLVDACAELAQSLLRACAGLTVLASSREALGVAGEVAWLVPPLAGDEAARLFVERARAASPRSAPDEGDAAVAEICRRLDGLPLAIELAAARVRLLAPAQIAARLDDAFRLLTAGGRTALPRHRTLRAAMEWSHALLDAREQALLRRLAVFAGGFALDAAEAVCAGDPLGPDDILDGVAALVDKSLVVMEPGEAEARYHLLETVRQYARERLAGAGESDAVEAAHARHVAAMAAALAPRFVGAAADAVARMAVEQDNLRSAMACTLRRAEHDAAWADAALRLADHLYWFWYGAGLRAQTQPFAEARRFTAEALRLGTAADPLLRARALLTAGFTENPRGEYEAARAHLSEALALAAAHGDAWVAVASQALLTGARLMLGDVEGAWAESEAAWAAVRPTPPSLLHSFVAKYRALAAQERGDADAAREAMRVNQEVGAAIGHPVAVAHGHGIIGRGAVLAGALDEAAANLEAGLRGHLALNDGWGLSHDLEWLAALAAARGRHADAARFMGAVDALRERVGVAPYSIDRPHRARREAAARAALGDAYERHHAEGRALAPDALVALAADVGAGRAPGARGAAPGGAGVSAPHAPPTAGAPPAAAARRLRVRALGPLRIDVGGAPVPPSAWGAARPRELLVYLLLHPEGRTREQVGLALWSDASAAQLRNSFHVTLHRLRKALGARGPGLGDWVALEGERYRLDPDAVEAFDAAAFERDVAEARRALRRRADGAADALARALDGYAGDLLDGEPAGDWHLEHRERLRRLHVDGLLALGAAREAEGRHARAADAFRRVLARDELHEDALRGLLGCHLVLGERADAVRAYRRFAERLRAELGAEPDPRTTGLVARSREGAGR